MTAGTPAKRRAVHQVLATLGYGDAIGNDVLGIQRALRGAGYPSDIFVETADRRVEPLTRDFRELVQESHPDNLLIHHFSIGSKASRVAYALPDRMLLVYHNITPPEFFVGIHKLLVRYCYHGLRELGAYVDRCDLAVGASEFSRRELESLGFTRTGVLPVVPDFSHLDVRPNDVVAREFDDEHIRAGGQPVQHKRAEIVGGASELLTGCLADERQRGARQACAVRTHDSAGDGSRPRLRRRCSDTEDERQRSGRQQRLHN